MTTDATPPRTLRRLEIGPAAEPWLDEPPVGQSRLLVTVGREPVAWVPIPRDITPSALRAELRDRAGWAALRRLMPAAPALPAEPLTIVIHGAGNSAEVPRMLSALAGGTDRQLEIIVLGGDAEAEAAIAASGIPVRFLPMSDHRMCRALNRAVRIATHDLVALVGADMLVDEGWTDAVRAAFDGTGAHAIVSFAVATGETSEVDQLLDARQLRVWGVKANAFPQARFLAPAEALTAGLFATNRLVAFRRSVVPGDWFDERLDDEAPGSPAATMALVHRLVAAGSLVLIVPAAFVWRPVVAGQRADMIHRGTVVRHYLRICRRLGVPRRTILALALRFWFSRAQLRSLAHRGGRLMAWEWVGAVGGRPA